MESTQKSPNLDLLQPIYELLQGGDPDSICKKYGLGRDELEQRFQKYQASRRQAALANEAFLGRVGRNEPCPCGSGKKYKKCCLSKHEEARQSMPKDRLDEMEDLARRREKIETEVKKGFELLFTQDYGKAGIFASKLIEEFPEDDRLHDIIVTSAIASEDYDEAFHLCRRRWQIAQEEKAYYQENGFHQREGADRKELVHFYSPSTWLEKLWISQKARDYRVQFPKESGSPLKRTADRLKIANDPNRFQGRSEEGFHVRRETLASELKELAAAGSNALPYVLPLTYTFSWASLFVPELLQACQTDDCVRLLAELSMFRFPYFSQLCLKGLEESGERVIPPIQTVLSENPAFDELKVGLIAVLGNLPTAESFTILVNLTEHQKPYIVNWAAEALGRHKNPEALPYLEKAKERLGELSKIAGAIKDIAATL
jgi:hypothetical protein